MGVDGEVKHGSADAEHDSDIGSQGSTQSDAQVRSLLQKNASPREIAELLKRSPMQRDAMVGILHRERGNAFVQMVMAEVDSMRQAPPKGLTVDPMFDPSKERPSAASNQGASLSAPAPREAVPALQLNAEPAQDQARRAVHIADVAQNSATGILGTLAPAYVNARDDLNTASVAELGGSLVGAFAVLHGAIDALAEIRHRFARRSEAGVDASADLEVFAAETEVQARETVIESLAGTVDAMIASTLTPHVFRGKEVADKAIAVSLTGRKSDRRGERLGAEVQRTISMLQLVGELKESLFGAKKNLDRNTLRAARLKLYPWATRPLDLAFLRAALGPIWDVLDSTTTDPLESKPSDVLEHAREQTKHTGWLGDIGEVDVDGMMTFLEVGGRDSADTVLAQLYTADPDARAQLLMQIKQRKLLDSLCSAVGWADVKKLHDSLGSGYGEIKTDLQHYFIGDRKYGPRLGSEWENHDYSAMR